MDIEDYIAWFALCAFLSIIVFGALLTLIEDIPDPRDGP